MDSLHRYLRGIDGQLPGLSGDQAKENQQREQGQKTQLGQDTVAIEATEGLNQSDYLRRLAHQIKEDNTRWQREEGSGIRAIWSSRFRCFRQTHDPASAASAVPRCPFFY